MSDYINTTKWHQFVQGFNLFNQEMNRSLSKYTKWIKFFGVLFALFSIFLIVLLKCITKTTGLFSDSDLSIDIVLYVMRTFRVIYILLAFLLFCSLSILVCPIKSIIDGLLAVLFPSCQSPKMAEKVINNNEIPQCNQTIVDNCENVTIAEKEVHTDVITHDEKSINDRIDAIKPLLIKEFRDHSFWGLGTDYSMNFNFELKELLNEKDNIMKLGHLAFLLHQNHWVKEDWPFNKWITTFFSTLGLKEPGETSPNKYSEKNEYYKSKFQEIERRFIFVTKMPEEYKKKGYW